MSKKYLILDVCGTLFDEDTTVGFVNFYCKRNHLYSKLIFLNLIQSKFSPLFYCLTLIEKLSNKHVAKHLVLILLKGLSRDELSNWAKLYVDYLFKYKKIDRVWSILDNESYDEIILASASVEPVIYEVSSRIGRIYVSSTLNYVNDKFTGFYQEDVTGNKECILTRKYNVDISQSISISDNFTDFELLQSSRVAYAVVHKSSHLERWVIDNVHVIRLY